jgi:hypothetical protein
MSNRILRVFSILRRRMLSNREKLRYHFLSCYELDHNH